MTKPLHVLIVEDSEDDALLLLCELRRGGFEPAYERVEIADALKAALGKKTWDVILCDYGLPKFSAPGALELVKESGLDLPVIVVSGTIGEETAADLMRAGAHDLIRKENLARLVPAVEREISEAEVRHERKRAEETIRYQALHDPLTDLPNRALFVDRLASAIASARRSEETVAVVIVDLDRFQVINHNLGHETGDRVLQAVAARLSDALCGDETVARIGADQFLVLSPGLTKAEDAALAVRKVRAALQPALSVDGHDLHLTAGIGISLFPLDGRDAETLMNNADTALHRVKEQGGNGYQFFEEAMNVALAERFELEAELRRALEKGHLVLHYQPKVDLKTWEITGAEALLRWQHPEKGLVSPATFIPLAEETGLIVPLGAWALHAACAQLEAWRAAGSPAMRVSVNLSGYQLREADFPATVRRVLERVGLDPGHLELEITESTLMDDVDATTALFRELHEMGIKFSIDDFGTGYSSLRYLQRFPIDSVKIDQSFVRNMTSNPNDAAIVQATILMSHSLKMRTIAEGIETQEQATFLRAYQCDEGQGYFHSRPLPAEEMGRLLAQGTSSGGRCGAASLPKLTPVDPR